MFNHRNSKNPWLYLSVLLISTSFIGGCGQSETTSQPPAIPVKVLEVKPGQAQSGSEFVGTLEAVQRVELKAQIEGQVQQILTQPGAVVSANTLMMVLKPDQTQPQFEGSVVALQNVQIQREAAVRQQEVAQAKLATAQSDFELAQTNFNRADYLLEQGAVGKFQYDLAKNSLDTARNQVKVAQEELRVAAVNIREAEGRIREAQTQVQSARVNVDFKQIVAPMNGVVGDIPVNVGDYITIGQTLTHLTKNDAFDLRISIPANKIDQLRLGLPVELTDPSTQRKLGLGEINFISPNVDNQAQSVLVKARFNNPNNQLKNGQFVQSRVIWGESSGILVPVTAVTRTGAQGFVFVISKAESSTNASQLVVKQQPVKLGEIQGNEYEIQSGINAGDQIAISNILRLRNGTAITPES